MLLYYAKKKDRKSTLLEMFFLALIQILMQAVVRIWLLVGLMYLLDPQQDPPCVCPLTFLRLWVENNIGIYLDSIYIPCQPTRSFEFVCLDSQCHKVFGSKPQIYGNPKRYTVPLQQKKLQLLSIKILLSQ